MSVINKISDSLKPYYKYYFRYYDKNINLILYFEVVIDKKGKKAAQCNIIDHIPSNAPIEDYYESPTFKDLILKTRDNYINSLPPNDIDAARLYYCSFDEWQKNYPESYRNYINTLDRVKEKCRQYKIPFSTNPDEVLPRIIDFINEQERKDHYSHFSVNSSVKPIEIRLSSLSEELKETINNHKFKSFKFDTYRFNVNNYISSFTSYFSFLNSILEKKSLTENDRILLERYCEFLIAMPKIYELSSHLEECSDSITAAKMDYNKNKYRNNTKFYTSVENLLAKCDPTTENIYMHATVDLEAATSILNNGLYTFGGVDSFGSDVSSVDQLLSYEYGSYAVSYDCYIVVFRLPKDHNEPTPISEEEAESAQKFVKMRRSVIMQPTGKIDTSDILGFIDKKSMKVIENPKFICLSSKKGR